MQFPHSLFLFEFIRTKFEINWNLTLFSFHLTTVIPQLLSTLWSCESLGCFCKSLLAITAQPSMRLDCIVPTAKIPSFSFLLKSKCLVKSFHFINQSSEWILSNGALDFSLFYSDSLYLVEKGKLKLGKSILKAINSNSNANPYKNAVWFNLNECDFPLLPSSATEV